MLYKLFKILINVYMILLVIPIISDCVKYGICLVEELMLYGSVPLFEYLVDVGKLSFTIVFILISILFIMYRTIVILDIIRSAIVHQERNNE